MGFSIALFVYTLLLTNTVAFAQDYCTTAPSSVYSPTYSPFTYATVVPPIPCDGQYAIQQGYCCKSGFDCINAQNNTCTCLGGPLLWKLPLAPCVTQNPYYSGCPGNMLDGLCCSGPGVFMQGLYNDTVNSWPVCNGCTAVFNATTAADGTVQTTTLPPGISYTNTVCGTCPLTAGVYAKPSTTKSSAFAVETARVVDVVLVKIIAAGAVLAAL